MRINRLLVLVLCLAVATALVGCSAATSESGGATSGEGSSEDIQASAEVFTPDLEWLEGEWAAETALVYIDNPVLTPAADQPMAEWIFEIDGSTMYMVTDMHTYEGTITSDDGVEWRYVASSTYTDGDGIEWTSEIDVTGAKTGEGFQADMLGEISSDTEGHLYSAQWSVKATPMAEE